MAPREVDTSVYVAVFQIENGPILKDKPRRSVSIDLEKLNKAS